MLRQFVRTGSGRRITWTVLCGLSFVVPQLGCSIISPFCGTHFLLNEFGTGITPAFETSVSGGTRIYRRTFKVSNVCADEHVTASFFVTKENFDSTLQLPVTIKGYIFYSLLFPNEEVILANNTTSFDFESGDVEAGLKQQFGDEPAEYFIVLEISFPTTGVESQDLNYVNNTIEFRWNVDSSYFEYTGGGGS